MRILPTWQPAILLPTVALLCWTLLTSCDPPTPPTEATNRRIPAVNDANIIVISFDALRADVLGTYGNSRGATPQMDGFADSSAVFEQAYSVAPVTPTAFAGLFSGMLPTRVLAGWDFRAETTLASSLTRAGYLSAAIMNNVHLTPERGYGRGFQQYDWRRNDPDEQVLEDAKSWLQKNSERRFFLWVHFLRPHAPYRDRPEARHLYTQENPESFKKTTGGRFETSDARDLERVKDLYYGEVWTADHLFGDLLAQIQQLGLVERSIIVLTADHGEEFKEHGGLQHGELYEEHLRVPLIFSVPGLAGGVRWPDRASTIDLLPTLLSIVGHPSRVPLDGVDRSQWRESTPVVAFSMTDAEKRSVSLLEGSHKLILSCWSDRRALQLFDLTNDPGEQRDLALSEIETVRKYRRRLASILEAPPCQLLSAVMGGSSVAQEMDSESVKALKALGYLD